MKITQEQYTILTAIANDIAVARVAPKDLERHVKIVVQDDGKDRVVQKFSPDMTRAAILLALVAAIEADGDYTKVFLKEEKKKPVSVEDHSQEPDVFTAEALAKIPPGKPDASTLHPRKKNPRLPGDGESGFISGVPVKAGDLFQDEKGRWWKIIDGKKRQQKKPNPTKP